MSLPPQDEAPCATLSMSTPVNCPEFSSFYKATLAPLRNYLTRFLGSRTEAQDVAQDAYVRIYAAGQNRPEVRTDAFLFTTARHLALNELRHRRAAPFENRHAELVERVLAHEPNVAAIVMGREELDLLKTRIASLPAGCRQVLLLHRSEDFSYDEIAKRLEISRSTVEKQLARALRLLREIFAADNEERDSTV